MIGSPDKSRLRGTLALGAVLAGLACVMPAGARADRDFLPDLFPSPPSPPSTGLPYEALTGWQTPAHSFVDACGLAVNPSPGGLTGVIFVADHNHDVIDRFQVVMTEKGPRTAYWGQDQDADPLSGPCGLALGAEDIGAEGEVIPPPLYVNEYRGGVMRYENGAATTIDDGLATGVAVDPGSQRLYVTHPTFLAVYEPNGVPVMEGEQPLHIGEGALTDAYGTAVSRFTATAGYVYVADAADETVKVFDPATDPNSPVEVIDGVLGPQQGFRNLRESALAVDQWTGNLLVVDQLVGHAEEPPIVVDEFSPQGNFRGQLQHEISGGEPSGIAFDAINGDVYVTTGRTEDSGVYAFGPASPSHALLLTKAGTGEGTVTSTPANISCPASCSAGEAEFDAGSMVSLEAAAAPHSSFSGWSVAGSPSACQGTASCQIEMVADMEVSAEFTAIPQQSLSVTKTGGGQGAVTSSPEGIDCGDTCVGQFDEGSTVTLTAGAAAHFHLAGWSVAGDPGACQGTDPCEVTMDAAKQVSADFERNSDRTLAVSVTGAGKVRSAPAGIDCPSACASAFAEGSVVSLSAEPAPGFELLAWSGACSGKLGCFVDIDADRSVTAVFVPIEYALAVSVIGAGTGMVSDSAAGIDCGLACAGIYRRGIVLHLTAKAAAGSRFIGFLGCDTVAARTCTVAVSEAKTVTAIFAEAPQISVRRVEVRGARATLAVDVPAPGLLKADGRGVKDAQARARREGVLTLQLALNRKGRRSLRAADEGKLSIRVALLFISTDGSKTTAKKVVTFRREGRAK